MSMSEDVAGSTIGVVTKGVATAAEMSLKTLEGIFRMMHEIAGIAREREATKREKLREQKYEQIDVLSEKTGSVSYKELQDMAIKRKDTLVYSDQGLTAKDVKQITERAKKCGIAVSFSQPSEKQMFYPVVMKGDLPLFKQICAAHLDAKLQTEKELPDNEREYDSMLVNKWEVGYLQKECQKQDIAVDFMPHPTDNDKAIFIFHKADQAKAELAVKEIGRKCSELDTEFSVTKDENGFFTVRDSGTGKEFSFEGENQSHEILSAQLQEKLKYDKVKADLAAAKFGKENLSAEQREKFLANEPQAAFSSFAILNATGKEDTQTQPFKLFFATGKLDKTSSYIMQSPTGEFTVLQPNKQTRKIMAAAIAKDLNIQDKKLLNSLMEKMDAATLSTIKENKAVDREFSKQEFDFTKPENVSGMRRTDSTGQVFVKQQPVDSVHCQIERTSKDFFKVTSKAISTEFDQKGNPSSIPQTEVLSLSFSDAKSSFMQLTDLYKRQGVPDAAAKEMAKDAIKKAEAQPAEKVVYIEEVKEKTAKCFTVTDTAEIPLTDGKASKESIKEAFGCSDAVAELTAEKVEEYSMPDLAEVVLSDNSMELKDINENQEPEMDSIETKNEVSVEPIDQLGGNGHEAHPEGNMLNALENQAENAMNNAADKAGEAIEDAEEAVSSIGGR